MKISKNDQRNLSKARSQAEKNAAYAMSKLNENIFKETLKHNDDMIAYHRERLVIAELKRDFFRDLALMADRGDVDVVDLVAKGADFLKAEKKGLEAVKAFFIRPSFK